MGLVQAFAILFFGACLLALLVAAVAFLASRFSSNTGTQSPLDDYLRSEEGNDNPSHIPVSYSHKIEDRTGWFATLSFSRFRPKTVSYTLDSPEVQRQKFENAETTTSKELRAIDK